MAQLGSTTVTGTLDVSGSVSCHNGIELHYNDAEADYTSRIIANGVNILDIGGGKFGSIRLQGDTGYFFPETGGNYSLGKNTHRWYKVWVGTAGVDTSSLAELKTEIKPLTSALDEIDKTDVYNYKYKETIARNGDDIIHTGFVIGENYNCSELLMGETKEGIELYSAIGLTFGGVKELYEIVKRQQKEIEELKEQIQELK